VNEEESAYDKRIYSNIGNIPRTFHSWGCS